MIDKTLSQYHIVQEVGTSGGGEVYPEVGIKARPAGAPPGEYVQRCFCKGQRPLWLLLAAVVCLLQGCATTTIRIVVDPELATVNVGETQDLTAVVTGTNDPDDKAVTWSVCDGDGNNCVSGGNATLGTIGSIGLDSSGNSMARYTAPSTEPSPPDCLSCPTGCSVVVRAQMVSFEAACYTRLIITTPGNPVPSITSLTPSTATVGGASFTLTVDGSGFVTSSVVRWNGSDRTTTFVDSTQLTADIPASDIATAGSADITVFNPAPGGGESVPAIFNIDNPVPAIAQITPSSATEGDPAFALTLDGSGFISTSVVRWDGSDRTTTFVSSTQLMADIAASDIATAGTASVSVFNPTPGGGTSNALTFTINTAGPPAPGVAELVSVASDGTPLAGLDPAISADGRFIAFEIQTPGTGIYVRDTCLAAPGPCVPSTVLVSVASDGTAANNFSVSASINADGRFVAFQSLADNLVAGDSNATYDIFVHDRDADEDGVFDEPGAIATIRVSVDSNGTEGNLGSLGTAISADGRFVAFSSEANNLVAGDTNFSFDIFLHDRDFDEDGIFDEPGDIATLRVSVDSGGTQLSQYSYSPAISPDGRFVAFRYGGVGYIYARDTCIGAPVGCTPSTVLVSVASDGSPPGNVSDAPSICAGGRFIAFQSYANDLVAGDTNGVYDIFVHDRDADNDGLFDEPGAIATIRVSVASDGTEGNGPSFSVPSISADGRFVAFWSSASNLVTGDTNTYDDVFVRDTCAGAPLGCAPSTVRVSVASDGTEGNGYSTSTAINADGRFAAFASNAANLVADDANGFGYSVFLAATGF